MAAVSIASLMLVFLASAILGARASDPNILSDFIVPEGVTVNAEFFTHRDLRQSLNWSATPRTDGKLTVSKATQIEFPALQGQSVSMAVLEYAPGTVNVPHTHPRSAEILLVLKGWLEVGFVTSDNKIFVQYLYPGDMFVFPKGLVHYQMNRDVSYSTIAVSAFGSANAGTISLPITLFGSGIGSDVLAKSFRVDTRTIELLQWYSIKG